MTRDEAIELVKSAFDAWEYKYDTGDDWSKEHEARDMAIESLERTLWIPVSDGLPKDNSCVLVTVQVGNRDPKVRSGYYYKDGHFHIDNGDFWESRDKELVAWMPLLQPYLPEINVGKMEEMDKKQNLMKQLARMRELQVKESLKETEELQYENDNSSKLYIGKSYCELRSELKQNFKYKKEKYDGIVAVFCNTQEEFDFVKYFYRRAYSSSCRQYELVEIGGNYDGPDWYFCEHQDIDYGMGAKDTDYWIESMAEKKRRFSAFVSEYE